MTRHAVCLAVALATLSLPPLAPGAARSRALVERGRYLVERVAMCADCHTPRDERGELDRAKWLRGSRLDFEPTHEIPGWVGEAPEIAGLSGWRDADAIRLFETGKLPNGKPLGPPMPQYKMSRADAEAVVAYLKSLEPARR